MKSLDSQIRQKSFRVNECQRRIAQLEGMIAELKRRSADLERDIHVEHGRTKISDPNHFAYSPLAKSLGRSRENLEHSIQTFEGQVENEKLLANEALESLNALIQEGQGREGYANGSNESSTRQSAVIGLMVSVGVN
jgi:flagellar FliJ protein